MKLAHTIKLAALKDAFSDEELSKDVALTDSIDEESLEETERLRGKRWYEVESVILEPSAFEMPLSLSATAYHYFFPAFILASQKHFEKAELTIQYALRVLCKTDNEEWLAWRRLRWALFTKGQWQLIVRWLNWLEEKAANNPAIMEAISEAKEVINRKVC